MPKDQTSLLDSTDSPPSSTPPGPTEQGASVTSAPMPKDQANLLLATFSEGLESLKRKYPAATFLIDSPPQSADGDDEAGCEDDGDNAALHVDALILGATARSPDDSVDVSTRRRDQSAAGSPAEDIAETTCVNLSVDDDCASPVLRKTSRGFCP